ncbi:hypothetical protein RJ641_017811, partial [Dillenia turbinata]
VKGIFPSLHRRNWKVGYILFKALLEALALNSYYFLSCRSSKLENQEQGHVVATCRNLSSATGLLDLKNDFAECLNILPFDLTIESTIEVQLLSTVSLLLLLYPTENGWSKLSVLMLNTGPHVEFPDQFIFQAAAKTMEQEFGSLNLLINASGILSVLDVMQPETTLSKLQKSSLLMAYEDNAVGPILVVKVGGGSGTARDVAVVASLSARVGTTGDDRLGG